MVHADKPQAQITQNCEMNEFCDHKIPKKILHTDAIG